MTSSYERVSGSRRGGKVRSTSFEEKDEPA
jgi:hypothetical protein